jgi:hypothetical protein
MRGHIRQSSIHTRGQVLVLVAVAIFVILGALGLCTDIAVFYFNWSQLRKEADAAALAGASYLPNDTGLATTTSAQYVQLNGQAGDSIVQNSVGSLGYNGMANSSLTVKLSRTVPYHFGRVFGLLDAPVVVLATAAVQPISGANGWIPIAMPCTGPLKGPNCFNGCTPSGSAASCSSTKLSSTGPFCYQGATPDNPVQITLTTAQTGPGNWEPLACVAEGNSGVAGYTAALSGGCGDQLQVDGTASLMSQPGSIANATFNGLSQLIQNCSGSSCPQLCPSGNLSSAPRRMVLIPLMDTSQFQGRTTASVYGFLNGWIESVNKSAGNTTVVVDVIDGTVHVPGTPDPNGPNTGAFAPLLIQ